MTSPTLESTTVTTGTSNATSHSFDLPATVNSGDHLIALCVFGDDDTAEDGGTLDDWTLVDSEVETQFLSWRLYYLVADGTEDGGTIDFTTGEARRASAVVARVSGAWASGGEGTAYSVSSPTAVGFGDAPNPNSVTAAWGSADQLYVAMLMCGNDGATVTAPSGYGSLAQVGTSGLSVAAMAFLAETSASDDPPAFGLDLNETHQTITMVIRPLEVAGDTTITATTSASAVTSVSEAGDTTITATTSAAAVTGSVGQGDTTITATSSATAALSMTGDATITATTSASATTRDRGVVLVAQGESAVLDGTWSTLTASSARLFVGDPTAMLTAAAANALTEADFTEQSFTGYSAASLTSGNWTVTPGTPTDATHTEVTFAATANPASPISVYGYYVTRDSDGQLMWFEVFSDGPFTIEADTDQVALSPKITLGPTL